MKVEIKRENLGFLFGGFLSGVILTLMAWATWWYFMSLEFDRLLDRARQGY